MNGIVEQQLQYRQIWICTKDQKHVEKNRIKVAAVFEREFNEGEQPKISLLEVFFVMKVMSLSMEL